MEGSQLVWMLVALAVLALATFLALRMWRSRAQSRGRASAPWFVAAGASLVTLIFTTAQVIDLAPSVTVVDGGTVALAGVLTGLFLGLGLSSAGVGPGARD